MASCTTDASATRRGEPCLNGLMLRSQSTALKSKLTDFNVNNNNNNHHSQLIARRFHAHWCHFHWLADLNRMSSMSHHQGTRTRATRCRCTDPTQR